MATDFSKIDFTSKVGSTNVATPPIKTQPQNITTLPKYTYQAPTPSVFRQAFSTLSISKEQQKANEQLLIKELKSKDGKIAAIAQGAALGILDPFQISKLFKEGQQAPEVAKLIEELTYKMPVQKNVRATELGLTPYAKGDVKVKAETVGNFIGSAFGIDPLAIGLSKALKFAIGKYAANKLASELVTSDIDNIIKAVSEETNKPESTVRQLLLESPEAKQLRQDVLEEQTRIANGEPIRLGGEIGKPKTPMRYVGAKNPIFEDLAIKLGDKINEIKAAKNPPYGRPIDYRALDVLNEQVDNIAKQMDVAKRATKEEVKDYILKFKRTRENWIPKPAIPTPNVPNTPLPVETPLQFKETITKNIPRQDFTQPQVGNVPPSNIPSGATQPISQVQSPTTTPNIPEVQTNTLGEMFQPKPMGILPEDMQLFDMDKGRLQQIKTKVNEAVFNTEEYLDTTVSKLQEKLGKFITQGDVIQHLRGVRSKVESFLDEGLVKRTGDVVRGDSYTNLFNKTFKKYGNDLHEYLLNMHNIDRLSLRDKPLEAKAMFEAEHPEMVNLTAKQMNELKNSGEFGRILVSEYEKINKDVLKTKNKPVLNKTKEDSIARVEELLKKKPELANAAKEISEYWDRVMKETLVPDIMSEEQYLINRNLYPHYVPTYRIFDDFIDNYGGIIDGYGGRGIVRHATSPQPVKDAVGDVSKIIPLGDQFAMLINRYTRAKAKNDVILNLLDSVEANPELWADKARLVSAGRESMLDKSTDEILDEFDLMNIKQIKNGIYTLTGHRNGEQVSLQVNKTIFEEMRRLLGQEPVSKALQVYRKVGTGLTDPFKNLVTGHNPLFGARNISRDIPTGIIQSIEKNPLKYGKGLKDAAVNMAEKSDKWLTYKAMGANKSGFYDVEKGYTKSYHAKQNPFGKALDTTWNGLGKFNEYTEQLNRFAEYLRAIEKYGDTPEGRLKASNAATEVTTNFSKRGWLNGELDRIIPYHNAALQGIRKSVETTAKKPVATLTKAGLAITVPSVILDQYNKNNPHYEEIDNRTKDTYYLVPDPRSKDENGYAQKFAKIPKAREYGVLFGDIPERALRLARGEEDTLGGIGKTLATNFIPPTQDISKPLREALRPKDTGMDYLGRPIVPVSMQGKPAPTQYDESSSFIAKRLGEITQNLPTNMQISPKKADYLLSSYGSWLGQGIQGLSTEGAVPMDRVASAIGIPVSRSFVADSSFSNKNVTYFFDKLSEAQNDSDLYNKNNNIPSGEKTVYEEKVRAMNAISTIMGDISAAKKSVLGDTSLNKKQKEDKIRELQLKYVDLAKNGLEIGKKEITPSTTVESFTKMVDTVKADTKTLNKYLADKGLYSINNLSEKQLEHYKMGIEQGLSDKALLKGFASVSGLTKNGEKYQAINNISGLSAQEKSKLVSIILSTR